MQPRCLAALGLALVIVGGCSGTSGRHDDAATDEQTDQGTTTDAAREVTVIGGDVDARDTSAADVAETGAADATPDTDAADAGADANDADGDAMEAPPSSICPAQIPTLAVPSGAVKGVLQGMSNNPIVSCQGGVLTPGPDAFYTMKLTQAATVDIHVTAPIETLIALRKGPCSDSISEVACGQDPALDVLPTSGGFDAGFGPQPTGMAGFAFASSDGGGAVSGAGGVGGAGGAVGDASPAPDAAGLNESDLRVRLAAGTYTIVIDSFATDVGTQASYTIDVSTVSPLPNSACGAPTLLSSGQLVSDQSLDLAGAPTSLCGTSQSALYYSVGVPPGQRLTARATPTQGDRAWMPSIQAFTACSSGQCLGQGHSTSGTTQELDWTNNDTSWQLVDLAVASDGPVTGATFDLNVVVVDLMATCSRPTPIKDGTTLLGEDLSIAPQPAANPCNGNTTHAYFYQATLLPAQTVTVSATPSGSSNGNPFAISLGLITSCDTSAQCTQAGSQVTFTNGAKTSTTALFEVSPNIVGFSTVFDLHVSIPLPPANIIVTPTSGLVTSENGTTATFQVTLTSPPTADVSISIASDTPTEGVATPTKLTFTAANWMTPQTVTVKGIDDAVSDGSQPYTIVTSPAVSDDARYSGLDPSDVSATNLDNDPGLDVVGADDLVTSESGATATFTVQLNSAPKANVTVPLSSSDTSEGTVSPAKLVFTTTNWNVPQTVTLTGVDDALLDGTQAYTIVTGALVSTDKGYSGFNPADLTAHNLDDDYGAVAVKLLSGSHSCNPTNRFPIARDDLNQLYIVMSCESGLWLTTSTDGGVTFTDPTMISNSENASSSGLIGLAGGPGGFVYLAFQANDGSGVFMRSTDAGMTWDAPIPLVASTNTMQLVAAGRRVALLTDTGNGDGFVLVWNSVDGGASFATPSSISDDSVTLGISPDGATEWLLEIFGSTALEKSTDGGQTFTVVGDLGLSLSPSAFGKQSLFGVAGSELIIDNLASPSTLQDTGSSLDQALAISVDDVDTATVLDLDPDTQHLRATRVVADPTTPVQSQTLVGPSAGAAGTVPLSRKAAAIGFNAGSVVLYTTATF